MADVSREESKIQLTVGLLLDKGVIQTVYLEVDPQLLLALTDHALLEGLLRLALTAGKLPFMRGRPAVAALAKQDFALLVIDDGRTHGDTGHVRHRHPPLVRRGLPAHT